MNAACFMVLHLSVVLIVVIYINAKVCLFYYINKQRLKYFFFLLLGQPLLNYVLAYKKRFNKQLLSCQPLLPFFINCCSSVASASSARRLRIAIVSCTRFTGSFFQSFSVVFISGHTFSAASNALFPSMTR